MFNDVKSKRKKHSLRRIVVDAFSAIMFAVFMASVCSMDSEAWYIPTISLIVSFSWLIVYAWAKGWMIGGKR